MTPTLALLITTAVAAAHFALRRWQSAPETFPDGTRYLFAGQGARLHRPFHLRWLLPSILRDDARAWRMTTGAATIALAPLTLLFLVSCGLDIERAFVGALLVPGLPGVFRIGVVGAYLVDSVAMALALMSATLIRAGVDSGDGTLTLAGLAVTVVAACTKESTPLFIAALAWHPIALMALFVVAVRHVFFPPSETDIFDERSRDMLRRPHHWAKIMHRDTWFDATAMLLPWGVAAVGFASLARHPWALVTVILAYAQTLVATDTVRLYQWAFPAMIYAAAIVLPIEYVEYAGILVVTHWFLPWQSRML